MGMKLGSVLACLIVLVGLFSFTTATTIASSQYKIAVDEGWNLLHGLASVNQIYLHSEIKSSDITAIYGYSATEKKYILLYPSQKDSVDISDLSDSFWVYSKKSGWIDYYATKQITAQDKKLSKGWNFVGLTKDIYQLKIKDFKGTCQIEKIAGYQRQWSILTDNLDERMLADTEQDLGRGMIVKVSNDCTLSLTNGGISNPPAIPN